LKGEIESALAPLLGQDLLSVGRAGNIEWFIFGRHDAAKGKEVELAPFSLHASCPWRIVAAAGVLAGGGDHRRPASLSTPDDDFDAGKIGSELVDVRHAKLRELLEAKPHSVSKIRAEDCGALHLSLSEGLLIQIIPDASPADHDEVEFWRFFQPGLDYAHFVVSSNGIDRVSDA